MNQDHLRALEELASDASWDASGIEAIVWASCEALGGATAQTNNLELTSRVLFLLSVAHEKLTALVDRLDSQPGTIRKEFEGATGDQA